MTNTINGQGNDSHFKVREYPTLAIENWISGSTSSIYPSTKEHCEFQMIIANPARDNATSRKKNFLPLSAPVCLNLESLRPFESVEEQFQHYGITFHNAIALHPSNAAYPPHSGTMVLMGAPKSGWIEIDFSEPICKFHCYATSSQRILLSAYDREGKLLVQDDIPASNLAVSNSNISPNAPLKAVSQNISRITLYSLDGQLTVDDISFWF
ncbi:hypothetical protein IQ249_10535 [Lusitaniella coriacea LEGE 07157]|uniref:Uncharacterized protein n=1 Tax=Lusitaniella coriacea LEGE 07157 TaxID=945747 RepID=A0A8J7DW93_9CYAN|nr:hypothetical protein [Lusitaniella coriacea]MBE9116334.1 hypothetical protein [Lusitaniella coriacea LEGE 07157]